MSDPITRHADEIDANRLAWASKPSLRRAYGTFYHLIAERLAKQHVGGTAELGSGLGHIKETLPHCITTDLFANPHVDRVENAYCLGFSDGSLDNVILFDVFHHLAYPGTALAEMARVVRPGGRVVIFEPAMGLLGRLIYGLFHREPTALVQTITWEAPTGFEPAHQRYYAAQGNAWRIFYAESHHYSLTGWRVVDMTLLSALTYVGSGGFSGPSLYPDAAYDVVAWMDRLLTPYPRWFATRMLVVLERQ